jgi:hypothetical protein
MEWKRLASTKPSLKSLVPAGMPALPVYGIYDVILYNSYRVRLCFSSPVPGLAFSSGIYPGLNYLSLLGIQDLSPQDLGLLINQNILITVYSYLQLSII